MKNLLKKKLVKWIILEFSPNMFEKNKFINNQLIDMCNSLIKNNFLIIPIKNIKDGNYSNLLNNIKENHINIKDIEILIKDGIQFDILFYRNS